MTPDQRRAHLILHGQTLLDEWTQRGKLYAEGGKLYAEGDKLFAEGDKLQAEANKLWAEGGKLYAEGAKLWAEGRKLWADAVRKEFGPGCTVTWEDGTCTLSMGEVYALDIAHA